MVSEKLYECGKQKGIVYCVLPECTLFFNLLFIYLSDFNFIFVIIIILEQHSDPGSLSLESSHIIQPCCFHINCFLISC